MKKRKLVSCMLACMMTVSLFTACGDKESNSDAAPTQAAEGGQSTGSGNSYVVSDGSVKYSIDESIVSAAKPVEVKGDLYVTESMATTAVMKQGNLQRIASVLEKAANNGTITIGFVGSSITMGAGASSYENSYAGMVESWFKTTFPGATINTVNLGMYNGDSYILVHRIKSELIDKNPDLIFLDTACEDSNANSEEAFESMIRMIMGQTNKPAVINLITADSSYKSDSDFQSGIAFNYNLPTISYGSILEKNIENGTWKWTDVADADETLNPNDTGHSFIAYILTSYLTNVLNGVNESSYDEFFVEDVTKTSTMCRYNAANVMVQYPDKMAVVDNWAEVDLPSPTDGNFKKARATTTGEKCQFTVTGKQIGFLYYKVTDGTCGQFNIYLDGTLVGKFDADLSSVEGADHNYVEYKELGTFDKSGAHEIVIEKAEDSSGDAFYLCGFTIAY